MKADLENGQQDVLEGNKMLNLPAHVLNCPCDTSTLSSSKIDTTEAVPVLCTSREGLLVLIGKSHLGDLVGDVLLVRGFGLGHQPLDVLGCHLILSMTNQPPRTFGGEDYTNSDYRREHPLQSKRDSISPRDKSDT